VTPRWIGSQLRSRLSLLTAKVHGTFVVPDSESPKLENLFKRYGIAEELIQSDAFATHDASSNSAF
jgi:hypothetical protein